MKKTVIFLAFFLLILGLSSCKKEKCWYYDNIMTYYDQSEEAWNQSYQEEDIDIEDLQNQLNKIQRERENLRKQYKDCVKD